MGAPSSGLQGVLQHGAGPARYGVAVAEEPGEEGERHVAEERLNTSALSCLDMT